MFTKQFWNDRVVKYGHTGHAEPFYYCFDQEARKFAIRELLGGIDIKRPAKALDFGCGSGDFFELLLERFDSVCGFDISEKIIEKAKRTYAGNAGIFVSDNIAEIQQQAPYNLALSVTVLQNLNKAELGTTLRLLYNSLDKKGHVLSLDAFSSEEKNREHNVDKATANDWLQAMEAAGFKLVSSHAFYNPMLYPTASWEAYNKNLFLKIVKHFRRFTCAQKIMSAQARKIIYSKKDILLNQNSIFKIYILQKQAHADQTIKTPYFPRY